MYLEIRLIKQKLGGSGVSHELCSVKRIVWRIHHSIVLVDYNLILNKTMFIQHILEFVNEHIRVHHPDRKGQFNIQYVYDPDEYELFLEEVECNDDKIEGYIHELDRLEGIFEYYMTDELKNEFIKALDSMFADRSYHYRILINHTVASLGKDITFVAFGDETAICHITKIVFDIRSKTFIVEEAYRSN